MGKTLDALLGRNFNTSKLKKLAKLAVFRATVLKNERQTRCYYARSDVAQLLCLGHAEQALLRVEHVIKEQNMTDVFAMVEGYGHFLGQRVSLIQRNKEFPDELREAISGLIYMSPRVGGFPELIHIREIFTLTFGKEYSASAMELHNNHDVDPKMIQKLSTGRPSLESRLTVLKEIASENGMALQLEEEASVLRKVHWRPKKKHKDAVAADEEAFESAGNAAVAARATVELSPTKPWHNPGDIKGDENGTLEEHAHTSRRSFSKFYPIHDLSSESEDENEDEDEGEDSSTDKYGSHSERQEHDDLHNGLVEGSSSTPNSDSDGGPLTVWKASYHSRGQSKSSNTDEVFTREGTTSGRAGSIVQLKHGAEPISSIDVSPKIASPNLSEETKHQYQFAKKLSQNNPMSYSTEGKSRTGNTDGRRFV
ncbi:hypothetical protein Ancab_006314 [Ancistrocladus abbreviatus]